jgi:hypothetical protein
MKITFEKAKKCPGNRFENLFDSAFRREQNQKISSTISAIEAINVSTTNSTGASSQGHLAQKQKVFFYSALPEIFK